MKRQIIEKPERVLRSQVAYFGSALAEDLTIASSSVDTLLSYFPLDKDNNVVQFQFTSSPSQYLDLSSGALYLNMKVIKRDGTNLGSSDNVSCVSNLVHSVFKDLEVLFNGEMIYNSNDLYHYRSYLQTLLSSSAAHKKYELCSSLYYADTTKGVDFTNNEGLKKRKEFIDLSKNIELESNLLADIFRQGRYIPPNTTVLIRLRRAPPEFVLIAEPKKNDKGEDIVETTCPYKIVFNECRLKLTSHALNHPHHESIETALKSGKLGRIPMKQTQLSLHFIPSSVFQSVADRLIIGRIPDTLALCLIGAAEFNGVLGTNGFSFEDHGVSTISVTTVTSGSGVVTQQLAIDQSQNKTLEAFRSLALLAPPQMSNGLSRDIFSKGSCIYCFNLAPRSLSGSVQPSQFGTVRVQITFKSSTSKALVLLAYSVSDAMLEFDADKNYKFV